MQSRLISGLCGLAAVMLICHCSAYDPKLLPAGRALHPDTSAGSGATGNAGDAGALSPNCNDQLSTQVCGRPNADATCVSGRCLIAGCKAPYVDCDQVDDNGCETTLETTVNCGSCGTACRFSHAAASCNDKRCTLAACDDGYADCDKDPSNGCETGLNSLSDCGECGHTCAAPPNAVAACVGRACGVASCDSGFGDCNGDPKDGCEEPLNSATNCAACGASCKLPNADKTDCASGSCAVAQCTSPFVDCNGLASDGCEAQINTASSCGACGEKCALPHVASELCKAGTGAAAVSCGVDHGCAPDDVSCKTDDLANGCAKGYADCDQNPANGCETDLSRLSDCGSCKHSCVVGNTERQCKDGQCTTTGCSKGFDRCAAGQSCQSLAADAANCGTCGTKCGTDKPNCAGGKCTSGTCGSGTADCDGDSMASCETNLMTDSANCGGCGVRCDGSSVHATRSCQSGVCKVTQCNDNFGDCDGDPTNGCEVDLRTANDCGACGNTCNYPNGHATCQTGHCQNTDCEAHRGDCNKTASDGCEADLTLPSNCGKCGNVCAQLPSVVSSSCGDNGCALICHAGLADCDGRPDNGCEAKLSDAKSCGACGRDCGALSHVVSADCEQSVCKNLKCDPGYADCNGDPSDGCERMLNTQTDCGRCDQACAPAHATGSCLTSQCTVLRCDNGFGDCDNNPQNGCETPLNTGDHCGACGSVCANGSACSNGQCACTVDTQCPSGESCCSGACASISGACFPYPCIPGTDLGANRLNCGGCGKACLLWCCATTL